MLFQTLGAQVITLMIHVGHVLGEHASVAVYPQEV